MQRWHLNGFLKDNKVLSGKGEEKSIPSSGKSMCQSCTQDGAQFLGLMISFTKFGLPWWLSWWRIRLQFGRPGFDSWAEKSPWRRERPPSPVFWPKEFHGLYSPWGCKESQTRLSDRYFHQEALCVSLKSKLWDKLSIFFFFWLTRI